MRFEAFRTDFIGYQRRIKQIFGWTVRDDPEGRISALAQRIRDLQAQVAEQQDHVSLPFNEHAY